MTLSIHGVYRKRHDPAQRINKARISSGRSEECEEGLKVYNIFRYNKKYI